MGQGWGGGREVGAAGISDHEGKLLSTFVEKLNTQQIRVFVWRAVGSISESYSSKIKFSLSSSSGTLREPET